MTDIKYYPLIDCDTEGTEKVAMIPAPNSAAVQAQSKMWLEEMIPHHFRLYTQNMYPKLQPVSLTGVRCPRCGTALKRISGAINETKRGLYVCSACAKK